MARFEVPCSFEDLGMVDEDVLYLNVHWKTYVMGGQKGRK
jgi:hypothetical protein